jgi:hypothetical protein
LLMPPSTYHQVSCCNHLWKMNWAPLYRRYRSTWNGCSPSMLQIHQLKGHFPVWKGI